ncbi:MAG: hypothetical protein ACSW75_05860, partial [Lachnospiraceae bacterium]
KNRPHMSFSTEIIHPYTGGGIRCALFDFDGTVSLIREGWQQIMTPYFCECIEALGTGEPRDAIEAEGDWIRLELEEENPELPPISDIHSLTLAEGEFVRNIGVNIRFYEGWDE